MATQIDYFDKVFDRPAKKRGGGVGRKSMYPFHEWLDADAGRNGKAILLSRRTVPEDASTGDFKPESSKFVVQLSTKLNKVVNLDENTEIAEIDALLLDETDPENSDIAVRVKVHVKGTKEYEDLVEKRERRKQASRERALRKAEEAEAMNKEEDELDLEDIKSGFFSS